MGFFRSCIVAVIVAALAEVAAAAPVAVGIDAFTGVQPAVDFETLAGGEEAASQYAFAGVTFAGGLFGNTENLDYFANPGGVIATNFDTDIYVPVYNPVYIDFTTPQQKVGFQAATKGNAGLFVESFREVDGNLESQGTVFYPQVNGIFPEEFVGIQDDAGISRLALTAGDNFTLGIDDVRIVADSNDIPEPSSTMLLAGGLLLLRRGTCARRTK